MENHKPVVVVARLASPICLRDPLHLDGLLLAARERRDGIENRHAPFDALARRHGVYAASCGVLVVEAVGGVAEEPVTRIRRIDMKGRDGRNVYIPPDSSVRDRTIGEMSPMRNTLVTEKVYGNVRFVAWQALGDKSEIEDLVSCHNWIGKMHASGYGEVEEWEVEEIDADPETCGLAANGLPLRNLPLDAAKALGIDGSPFVGRVEPPYARPDGQVDVVGPFMRDLVGPTTLAVDLVGYAY